MRGWVLAFAITAIAVSVHSQGFLLEKGDEATEVVVGIQRTTNSRLYLLGAEVMFRGGLGLGFIGGHLTCEDCESTGYLFAPEISLAMRARRGRPVAAAITGRWEMTAVPSGEAKSKAINMLVLGISGGGQIRLGSMSLLAPFAGIQAGWPVFNGGRKVDNVTGANIGLSLGIRLTKSRMVTISGGTAVTDVGGTTKSVFINIGYLSIWGERGRFR